MLIINSWFGRLGNNILQIINAIHYAINDNHNKIIFNKHHLLTKNSIIFENIQNINEEVIKDTFWNLKSSNSKQLEPYIMKEYFQKYIKPIFKIQKEKNTHIDYKKNLYTL